MEFSKKYHVYNSTRYHQIPFLPDWPSPLVSASLIDERALSNVPQCFAGTWDAKWYSGQVHRPRCVPLFSRILALTPRKALSQPGHRGHPLRLGTVLLDFTMTMLASFSALGQTHYLGSVLWSPNNPITIIANLQMSKPGDRGLEKVKISHKLTQLHKQERQLDLWYTHRERNVCIHLWYMCTCAYAHICVCTSVHA